VNEAKHMIASLLRGAGSAWYGNSGVRGYLSEVKSVDEIDSFALGSRGWL